MLVGNKYDMVQGNTYARAVSTEEASKFADKYNLMYAETSAKTGYNVKEAFESLIEGILNWYFLSQFLYSGISGTKETSKSKRRE